MIISIHLPKCAGTSFQQAIKDQLSEDVYLDYGNLITNMSTDAKNKRLLKKKQLINQVINNNFNYKCVHGHFYATKYLDVIDKPQWMTVIRNPYELVPSYYSFLKRKKLNGPLFKLAREIESLSEFSQHPWFCNIMSKQIYPLKVTDFSIIASLDRYDDFLRQFSGIIEREIPNVRENIGDSNKYNLTAAENNMIYKNNKKDIELYDDVMSQGGVVVNGI